MLKQWRLFLHTVKSRDSLSRISEVTDNFQLRRGMSSQPSFATVGQNFASDGKLAARVYAPYSIFKGKAALSAEPLPPTFRKVESGGIRIDRQGVIMLTFWPAIGERKYDWEKRLKFALSANEVGSLISFGSNDSCEFFHDPSMKSSNAGQVRKSLSIKAHADGSGYFLSLSVANNLLKTNDRISVPVSTAEFAVMRTAFSYALPRIMGWDQYNNNQLPQNVAAPKAAPDLLGSEWER